MMKNLIFYIVILCCQILQSCREYSHNSINLQYTFKSDSGDYNIFIKRKETSAKEYEEIYIDSSRKDYIISDTFYYKILKDTLFSLATYDINGKTYRNEGTNKVYVPIFVPVLLDGDDISKQDDSKLRRHFFYREKEKYSYLRFLQMDYYNQFDSFLWGTIIYDGKFKEMPPFDYARKFPETTGGCQRIINFTFKDIVFDTVIKCIPQYSMYTDYVCRRHVAYYTKNYFLIVDSTCSRNYISPSPESLTKIHELRNKLF